jgi:hypothetical protein
MLATIYRARRRVRHPEPVMDCRTKFARHHLSCAAVLGHYAFDDGCGGKVTWHDYGYGLSTLSPRNRC